MKYPMGALGRAIGTKLYKLGPNCINWDNKSLVKE